MYIEGVCSSKSWLACCVVGCGYEYLLPAGNDFHLDRWETFAGKLLQGKSVIHLGVPRIPTVQELELSPMEFSSAMYGIPRVGQATMHRLPHYHLCPFQLHVYTYALKYIQTITTINFTAMMYSYI